MNKTAIKNFAVGARRKLMEDVTLKAKSLGVSGDGIVAATDQSTKDVAFFQIGSGEPTQLSGKTLEQRNSFVLHIQEKAKLSDLNTAFDSVVEEVAYTWFNRLIAIRFMEVNDYLPSGTRVLSSKRPERTLPDMVADPFAMGLVFTPEKTKYINALLDDGEQDELFPFLFIEQCNALHEILPKLFEKTNHYTELLLNISCIDEDGVVAHLVKDILEEDFKEAVEIVGWLFQFYNTEPKSIVDKKTDEGKKVEKEDLPAKTQLFTPKWIVKYMVENSLGRLWLEQYPDETLQETWKYYLNEAAQTPEVQVILDTKRSEKTVKLQDIKFLDCSMGSGHILTYAFDIFMQLYDKIGIIGESAVVNILEYNLYGLDIDPRAYQLGYFAIMMKAREYDASFFDHTVEPMVYCPCEHEELENFGSLYRVEELEDEPQPTIHHDGLDVFDPDYEKKHQNWSFKNILNQKHEVVCTNPPYLGAKYMSPILRDFLKENFPDSKSDLFASFMELGNNLVAEYGYNCMVTMQSWMFLSSYENLRKKILKAKTITTLMHMENMVMGIAFGTAVANIKNHLITNYKGTYNHITLKDIGDDDVPTSFPVKTNRFAQVSNVNFHEIPGYPIAYWASENVLATFKNPTIGELAPPRQGLATACNDIFLNYGLR